MSLSLVCTACATVDLSLTESQLLSSERQILVQTISAASMQVHHCDKVDAVEVNEIKAGELTPLMQGLLRKEGSVTERWVTSLCGHKVKHTVFHGSGKDGRRALFISACDHEGNGSSMKVMRLDTAGNALSNWMAVGFAKIAGASSVPTEPAKGLALLMACPASS
jgi:hypothetical protein